MVFDPSRFENPSFQRAQDAIGAAAVAGDQNRQNGEALRNYQNHWWQRGIVDALVNGAQGAITGGMMGGIPGAIAGAGVGAAGGFAQDLTNHSKGYQGLGTPSVSSPGLGSMLPMAAMAAGKAAGAGAGTGVGSVAGDAMNQSPAYWAEKKAALFPHAGNAYIPPEMYGNFGG